MQSRYNFRSLEMRGSSTVTNEGGINQVEQNPGRLQIVDVVYEREGLSTVPYPGLVTAHRVIEATVQEVLPLELIQTVEGIGYYFDNQGVARGIPHAEIHSITCGIWPGIIDPALVADVAQACAGLVRKTPAAKLHLNKSYLVKMPGEEQFMTIFRFDVVPPAKPMPTRVLHGARTIITGLIGRSLGIR